MSRHSRYGIWLALLGVLILTPDTLFMRISGLDGWAMLAWRGILAGSILIVAWLVTCGERPADIRRLATPAGLGVALCQISGSALFCLGIAIAPVAIVLFGVATVPICAGIFSFLFAGERTRPATWVTTAVVLFGISIAVLGGEDGGLALTTSVALGAICGLAVAASLAFSFVIIRRDADMPILLVIGAGSLAAGFLGLGIGGAEGLLTGPVWAIAISGGILLPASFFLMSLASRHTAPTNVSLILLLETVIGPIWVWAGYDEAITLPMFIGGAIVIISLAIYIRHTAQRDTPG